MGSYAEYFALPARFEAEIETLLAYSEPHFALHDPARMQRFQDAAASSVDMDKVWFYLYRTISGREEEAIHAFMPQHPIAFTDKTLRYNTHAEVVRVAAWIEPITDDVARRALAEQDEADLARVPRDNRPTERKWREVNRQGLATLWADFRAFYLRCADAEHMVVSNIS